VVTTKGGSLIFSGVHDAKAHRLFEEGRQESSIKNSHRHAMSSFRRSRSGTSLLWKYRSRCNVAQHWTLSQFASAGRVIASLIVLIRDEPASDNNVPCEPARPPGKNDCRRGSALKLLLRLRATSKDSFSRDGASPPRIVKSGMKRGRRARDEIGRLRNGVIRNGGIMLIQSALQPSSSLVGGKATRNARRDTLA